MSIPLPGLWLGIIVLIVYAVSFTNGFTELDDKIFIVDNASYNEDVSNLFTSFNRGVFSDTSDTYYRPVLLDSFIINYQSAKTEVKGYHVVNILLHLAAVLLVFTFLKQIISNKTHAFLLSVLFAVHPALTQAVSWIPGRNDSLLAIFCLAYMITVVNYIQKDKNSLLLLQFVFLLLALFTKETALFIPPAFVVLLISAASFNWRSKKAVLLAGSWLLAGILWFAARTHATLQSVPLHAGELMKNAFNRAPVLLQYFGKVLLPFNLSVFPMMKETSYLFGLAAILLITALLYFSNERNLKLVAGGIAWFVILLLPVVLLPGAVNEQDFEQRLYLPVIGILIVLSQTVLFKNIKSSLLVTSVAAIATVFVIININQQQKFSDPVTFWSAAVETTPHSAYANMMLGARMSETDKEKAAGLLKRAYELNPNEKYINYYIGKMYIDRDSVQAAEKYFRQELKNSDYYESYFHLSRIEFERKNFDQSISYMEIYLQRDPSNQQAIRNYLMMLIQMGKLTKARAFIKQKQLEGIDIPVELVRQAGGQ